MYAYLLQLLLTYFIILGSISLFFGPFICSYYYKHKTRGSWAANDLNGHIERFFESREANFLIFFWAASEAVIWFVIPEFLLLLLVFMRTRNKIGLLLYDIYGTVVGTLLALIVHLSGWQLSQLPFIRPRMIAQVHEWYAHFGIWGLLFQPFSGVPYKVFTSLAVDYHFFIPFFVLVAIAVRISRYAIMYSVFEMLYPFIHPFVYRNYLRLFLGAVLVFSLLLVRVVHIYA